MDVIAGSNGARLSAASYLEVSLKVDQINSRIDTHSLDRVIKDLKITIEPVTVEQAKLARQAFQRFGRGHHSAGLNFGDCFVYALATTMVEPLLFKGNDFSRTDLEPARAP